MNRETGPIRPEDYVEPACLLHCGPGRESQSVPQRRIAEKLDEYMEHRDYAGAERHLLYWRTEAREGKDLQGQLFVANEMVGFYRKREERSKAFSAADEALGILHDLGFDDNLSAGTTYINVATACSAFGEEERALALFSRARRIYERQAEIAPELLGGLYNNMGLACAALGRFAEAYELYDSALEQMRRVPDGGPEAAITCLNIADALDAEQGAEAEESRFAELLKQAKQYLLNSAAERNGYFAFVCEKCAPGFRWYGDEETARQLEDMAERIYAGT